MANVRNQPEFRTWGRSDEGIRERLNGGFIFSTWAIAAALSAIASALIVIAVGVTGSSSIYETAQSNMATIMVTSFVTFAVFCAVTRWRLASVLDYGRFVNAIAVGVLHVVVLFVIFLIGLAVQLSTGTNILDALPGSYLSQLGVGFFSLERSAATVIPAVLLAAAVMPEEGDIPKGTQHETISPENSL